MEQRLDRRDSAASLNPAQRDMLAQLGARPGTKPTFRTALRADLAAMLEDGLAAAAEQAGGEPLFIAKHALATVLACEAKHVGEQGHFSWSVPTAKGTIAHKAVELSIHWADVEPLTLVDEVTHRLAKSDTSLGEFLAGLDAYERADLRSAVNDLVVKFLECFPPIKDAWRPTSESSLRTEFLGGAIVVAGKADLVLGRSVGNETDPDSTVAGKVIVDYKTGGFNAVHIDDLRLYALVETMRLGVPPRLLANYYLDAGRMHTEDVTEGLLEAAARRLVDGALKLALVRDPAYVPIRTAGPQCRFCPLSAECPNGIAWFARNDNE